MTPCIQNVLVDSSYDTMERMSDMDQVVFRDMLHTTDYSKKDEKKDKNQPVINITIMILIMK